MARIARREKVREFQLFNESRNDPTTQHCQEFGRLVMKRLRLNLS